MPDAYDLLPYTEHAYAESHPDNLSVIAALSGFAPPAAAKTLAPRILELGCGRGGNLLPLAEAWPDATLVGIDRSAAQTRDATRVAAAAELHNVTFVAADFTDVRVPTESFDFVLCHGVYSWVPVASRDALLDRVRSSLAPRGVAYVSFNTLPGWYRRLAARDWMRFAARTGLASGPREALRWLGDVTSPEHGPYRDDLRAVHERLRVTDAAYLTHEYLADEHHPVHVATFLEEAAHAGLSYLGDALPRDAAVELLPEAILARALSLDMAGALTVADFARNTAFRRALLVRSDAAWTASHRLDPLALVGLRIASRLVPLADAGASDVESFGGAGVTVQVSGIERQALRALALSAPRSIPCGELATLLGANADALANALYDLWLATPGIDLHVREPTFVTTVSSRPSASAVARWHAMEGGPVTNVWHQEVALPEAVVRFVLGRLDGKTSVNVLVGALREREKERVSDSDATAIVQASLTMLARAALLVG